MAIQKNTAAAAAPAAKPEVVAAAVKAPAKAPAAPKTTAKAPAKAAEAAPEVEQTETATTKVGRKELAASIQAKVKDAKLAIPLKLAELVVELYEAAVIDALAAGHEVNLPGFGKFSSVAKPEQERPNPQKPGEKVIVPAHNAPKFKAGTGLKKALNGGTEVEDDATE